MNKKLVILPLLLTLLTGACTNTNPNNETKEAYMINDFENYAQLSLMKFPFPKHSDRGRFDLSDEHVTSGTKSLKYSNDYGDHVEVCHYFTNTVDMNIDTKDMKSIELDIFNASEFDTTCTFIIYNTENMNALLSQNYTLKKNESTHLSFELSKVALDFNYSTLICSSLKLYTLNTNYNEGIGYTFYIDNWHVKMGAQYTELDNQYKDELSAIQEAIDNLPDAVSVTTENHDELKAIANSLASLPDLYRRAVPNINKYTEALENYYRFIKKDESEIDLDRDVFLHTNEFFGSAQLQPDQETKADVYYEEATWPNEEEKVGSTKILFPGSSVNKFVYNSEMNLNDFDFIHFRIYNASNNYIRIWFSYPSNIYLDIASGEVKTASFSSRLLANQFYWDVLHLASPTDGRIINSSGALYFDEVYVTGRSMETRKAQLLETLEKLPAITDLVSENDYIESITTVKVARELLSDIPDTSDIDAEKINLIYELDEMIDEAGYGIAYNAYRDPMKISDYGENFAASTAISDETFGYVSSAHITGKTAHKDDPNKHEQAFTFANATTNTGDYNGFVIYIYNPTQATYVLSVRDTSWLWDTSFPLWTNMDLVPGWNRVEIKSELIKLSEDRKVCFLANDNGMNENFAGDWLFSSLVGVPREI